MIYDIAQTKSGLDMKWIALGEDILAEMAAPCIQGEFDVFIEGKNYKQELRFTPNDMTMGKSLEERSIWRLYEHGEMIGTIRQRAQKVKGLFQSYVYDEYQYKDKVYLGYEVGLGKKGLYLCIYRDNELVAVVDKRLKVTNYLDKYKCYLLYEEDWQAIIPYVIRYDSLKFDNMFERSVHATQHHKLNTIQKEVLAKYDPTFIEKVKEISETK